MWPGRSSWKEVGRNRDYGRMLVNVMHAYWRKAQKGTGCTTVQNGTKSGERFRRPSDGGSKGENVEERVEVARRVSSRTLSVKASGTGNFRMKMWESEEHQSWCMQVEGFRSHAATDGSLSGKTGKWGACGWAGVQLDYDKEMGPLQGMYGSMEADNEVQRTTKRTELTAFLCFLREVSGLNKVHGQQGNVWWVAKR